MTWDEVTVQAQLPEERCLLIARDSGNRNRMQAKRGSHFAHPATG